MLNRLASLTTQQAFSKPCQANLISKDTHLVFSINKAGIDVVISLFVLSVTQLIYTDRL